MGRFCVLLLLPLIAVVTAQSDACDKKYKKVGCYHQDDDGELLFSVRAKIVWDVKVLPGFLQNLACRCNNAAKEKNYPYFALRFWGECVGLKSAGHKYEVTTASCKNGLYKPCDMASRDHVCVGKGLIDMVYQIGRDGGYGKWSDHSDCSATCGTGSQQRTRPCDNPTPLANGNSCDVLGPATESKECNAGVECPVDGKFGKWTDYSACDVTCGGGSQARTRECDSPASAHGGKDCDGATKETKSCATDKCPVKVDGNWGDWSDYTKCSKTCDEGSQTRIRRCDSPAPLGLGKNCEGDGNEMKKCIHDFCKGPSGVAKAQELIEKYLLEWFGKEYPDKKPSGKFYKAIFEIQKVAGEEFVLVGERGKTVEERLKGIEEYLTAAAEGGSIDFARKVFGMGLYTFMKNKIKEGVSSDEVNKKTIEWMDKCKDKVGDENWKQILSSQDDTTLMFTMDTTGSMSDEIVASKAIAKSIIDATRDFKVDYILSPFNDPGTGPVTYKSDKDRGQFINDIDNLRARGGGDCPELAIKGMLNALDKGPKYGSPMFVFTDASPKDATPENMAALKSAAEMTSTHITFFTNLAGCTGGGIRGIKDYQDLASYTSGQVFPLKNEAELLKFKDYVAFSLSSDTTIASGGSLLLTSRKRAIPGTYTFPVDDGIKSLQVSVATSVANTAAQVTLNDPEGNFIVPKSTMSMTRIFEVKAPKAGSYALYFPPSAGKHEYNVEGISHDAIAFAHNFMFQESYAKGSPPFSLYDPIQGKQNTLIIRLGGVHRVNIPTTYVDIVDEHSNVLQKNLKLESLDSADVFKALFTPPSTPFKVRLTGKTNTGVYFSRLSRGLSRPSLLFMRPIRFGDEFTVKIGKSTWSQVHVLNFGENAAFEFFVTSQLKNSVSFHHSGDKQIRGQGFVSFAYTALKGTRGNTDRISITAVNKSTGETRTISFTILLL